MDQLRDIYSIWRCSWNVGTYKWKVHNEKIEIVLCRPWLSISRCSRHLYLWCFKRRGTYVIDKITKEFINEGTSSIYSGTWGSCCSIFSFMCNVLYIIHCLSLYCTLFFFFWPLYCLSFFYLRPLITV